MCAMRLDQQLMCRVSLTRNRRISEQLLEGSINFWHGHGPMDANVRTRRERPYKIVTSTELCGPAEVRALSNASRRFRRSGTAECHSWPFKTSPLKHMTTLRGVMFAESPNEWSCSSDLNVLSAVQRCHHSSRLSLRSSIGSFSAMIRSIN